MRRYAAKLLFEFRVTVGGAVGKRRICEERIVVLKAASGKKALARAKRKGMDGQYRYSNSDGNPVSFEFIGVMDLLRLDKERNDDEVWYDIVERLLPSERKSKLIPPASELTAIRNESPQTHRSDVSL